MTTDLAVVDATDVVLSRRDLDMVRRQVSVPSSMRPPSDQELDDFGRYCMARRLNPFDRQCYLAPIGGRWQPLVGVHGRLVIALRTGEVDGMEGPYFCHKREGVERARPPDWDELWDDSDPPHAAKFVVYRKGWTRDKFPVGIAPWELYAFEGDNRGGRRLRRGSLWRDNPPLILGYKAITRALDLVFQDVMPPSPHEVADDPDDTDEGYARDETTPRATPSNTEQFDELHDLIVQAGFDGPENRGKLRVFLSKTLRRTITDPSDIGRDDDMNLVIEALRAVVEREPEEGNPIGENTDDA